MLSVEATIDCSESLDLFLFPYFKQDPLLCCFTDVSPKSFFFCSSDFESITHSLCILQATYARRIYSSSGVLQSFISWLWFSSLTPHFYSAIIPLTSVEVLLTYTCIAESGHVVCTQLVRLGTEQSLLDHRGVDAFPLTKH